MAVAKIYPEPEKGGRGKTANSVIPTELTSGYLSHARTVLKWAPELADQVLERTPTRSGLPPAAPPRPTSWRSERPAARQLTTATLIALSALPSKVAM